jgi:hypothetical protein
MLAGTIGTLLEMAAKLSPGRLVRPGDEQVVQKL